MQGAPGLRSLHIDRALLQLHPDTDVVTAAVARAASACAGVTSLRLGCCERFPDLAALTRLQALGLWLTAWRSLSGGFNLQVHVVQAWCYSGPASLCCMSMFMLQGGQHAETSATSKQPAACLHRRRQQVIHRHDFLQDLACLSQLRSLSLDVNGVCLKRPEALAALPALRELELIRSDVWRPMSFVETADGGAAFAMSSLR